MVTGCYQVSCLLEYRMVMNVTVDMTSTSTSKHLTTTVTFYVMAALDKCAVGTCETLSTKLPSWTSKLLLIILNVIELLKSLNCVWLIALLIAILIHSLSSTVKKNISQCTL